MSVSPDVKWTGCEYADHDIDDLNDGLWTAANILSNIKAFGTFNVADAGVTLHATYNPETEEYTMDYHYYLIDYYDYEKLDFLNEQDALGWASGYELYGSWNNKYVWKSGSEVDAVYTTVYK